MKILADLKKFLPGILYSILGLVSLFIVYKVIMRIKAGGFTIGGIMADKAENEVISNQTGISPARIQELRTIALNLSIEMETNKDQTWWWGASQNVIWDSDIMKIVNNIKSSSEIVVVKNFYNNIFTLNRNLYNDLKSELSQSNLNQVPYISAII